MQIGHPQLGTTVVCLNVAQIYSAALGLLLLKFKTAENYDHVKWKAPEIKRKIVETYFFFLSKHKNSVLNLNAIFYTLPAPKNRLLHT